MSEPDEAGPQRTPHSHQPAPDADPSDPVAERGPDPESAWSSPAPAILRQAISIALAVAPFGLAFGVVAAEAGLSLAEAIGFSTLVFTGGAQFAAVSVLGDGGTAAAAVAAGLLLNLRLLAFGIVLAPALSGPIWRRALDAQLMIDESAAVATGQPELRWQRYGYLAAGLAVFVTWNATTILGASVLGGADELIDRAGIDATIPAAFLALVWPRLADGQQRLLAVVGAAIAFLAAPILPPGMPIVAAAFATVLTRPWRSQSSGGGNSGGGNSGSGDGR